MMGSRNIQSAIHFLRENPCFKEEKPYAFRFDLESAGVPQSNMEMREVKPISITDMRGFEHNFSLEANGFAVLGLDSKLSYSDYHDAEKLKVYFHELEELLKAYLGAREVKVFRHGVCQYSIKQSVSLIQKMVATKARPWISYFHRQSLLIRSTNFCGPHWSVLLHWETRKGIKNCLDTTPQEAVEEIRRQYGGRASELLNGRSQWIKYDSVFRSFCSL